MGLLSFTCVVFWPSWGFSSPGEQAPRCGGFLVVSLGSRACVLSGCGTQASLLHRGDLPRPGTEPVSPALQRGSLTIGPPRKPLPLLFATDMPPVGPLARRLG